MPEPIVNLVRLGGIWATLVLLAGWLAYLGTPKNQGRIGRVRLALNHRWFLVSSTLVATVSWCFAYWLLWQGRRYIPLAGTLPWLPEVVFIVFLVATVVAFLGVSTLAWARPWLTLCCVALSILLSNVPLMPAPRADISQGDTGDHVRFVQERLATLRCFEAAGEKEPLKDGVYGAETVVAVISFQQKNRLLLRASDHRYTGYVRPTHEFRLMTHPFPCIGTPVACVP
ncbi:MAG: peptidoglycan-binding protein [Gemmatimonadetes bacterium]|nr:peptidoglycan-binding protein [Gemmatimonadota bacterium]